MQVNSVYAGSVHGYSLIVRPFQDRSVHVNRETLTLGDGGVYSSFLCHAEDVASEYQLNTVEIPVKLGLRGMTGVQEDIIVDVAPDLLKQKATPERMVMNMWCR